MVRMPWEQRKRKELTVLYIEFAVDESTKKLLAELSELEEFELRFGSRFEKLKVLGRPN